MALEGILFLLFLSLAPQYPPPQNPVTMSKADLNERFLLQVSYEEKKGREDFMTSRSRIVEGRIPDMGISAVVMFCRLGQAHIRLPFASQK